MTKLWTLLLAVVIGGGIATASMAQDGPLRLTITDGVI